MHSRRASRLIAAICILALAAIPAVWFACRYHQQTLNHALIAAIKRSDAIAVESLLASGANPNARDTPAIQESPLQRVKHLFERPAPDLSPSALLVALNRRTPTYRDPPNYCRIVKALLSRGADVNLRDYHGLTAVNALYCHYDDDRSFDYFEIEDEGTLRAALEMLLSAGADSDCVGLDGQTPLLHACNLGETECVQLLLEHGANPNPKPVPGNGTPLSQAQRNGYIDLVKLLKAHGAKK